MRTVNPEATGCIGLTAWIDSLGKCVLLGLGVLSALILLAGPRVSSGKVVWGREGLEKRKNGEGQRNRGEQMKGEQRERERAGGEKHVLPSVTHKQGLCVGGVNRAAKSLLCRSRVFCFCSFFQLALRMKHEVVSEKSVGILGILNHLNNTSPSAPGCWGPPVMWPFSQGTKNTLQVLSCLDSSWELCVCVCVCVCVYYDYGISQKTVSQDQIQDFLQLHSQCLDCADGSSCQVLPCPDPGCLQLLFLPPTRGWLGGIR